MFIHKRIMPLEHKIMTDADLQNITSKLKPAKLRVWLNRFIKKIGATF
jgi:hypothetical protein